MNPSAFLRIERDNPDGSRLFVVHLEEPKFSLELVPDVAAPDQMGQGVIKRIQVPNSWAGDYSKYAKFIPAAQEFFARTGVLPGSSNPARRAR